MLQHAVTPNSVGSLVAWQQEDGVHAFTIEEKLGGEADDSILTEAYGNSEGFLQWHGPAAMSFWQLVQTDRDFSVIYSKPGSLSWVQGLILFPRARTVVLNMDSQICKYFRVQ